MRFGYHLMIYSTHNTGVHVPIHTCRMVGRFANVPTYASLGPTDTTAVLGVNLGETTTDGRREQTCLTLVLLPVEMR